MPKAIKRKISKPAKTEEGVTNILHETREFVAERQKTLLPVLMIVVFLALAAAGFFFYRSNVADKAAALEYEGYKIYYGFSQKQPLMKGENSQKALEKFQKAYDTRKSALSLFYIASSYYDMGRYDEALKSLKELNERFPDDERFVPLSYYKMAVINLKKGDKDAALKILDTIYHYKTGSFKDLALLESARILESTGKNEEAARKYEEIVKNFAGSPFFQEAQAKVGAKKG